MKYWRVGTISMGISLILLGIFLFVAQYNEISIYSIFLNWWPFILIVLGIEILVYLFLSRKNSETTIIKYDFLSILFVGCLGMIALGFLVLSYTGVMGELQQAIAAEEKTFDLPIVQATVPTTIKRIVIEPTHQPIEIEKRPSNEISLFGTYRVTTTEDEPIIRSKADYVTIHTNGDTMYVFLKDLPTKIGPFRTWSTVT